MIHVVGESLHSPSLESFALSFEVYTSTTNLLYASVSGLLKWLVMLHLCALELLCQWPSALTHIFVCLPSTTSLVLKFSFNVDILCHILVVVLVSTATYIYYISAIKDGRPNKRR
jgi:hypothetical protein